MIQLNLRTSLLDASISAGGELVTFFPTTFANTNRFFKCSISQGIDETAEAQLFDKSMNFFVKRMRLVSNAPTPGTFKFNSAAGLNGGMFGLLPVGKTGTEFDQYGIRFAKTVNDLFPSDEWIDINQPAPLSGRLSANVNYFYGRFSQIPLTLETPITPAQFAIMQTLGMYLEIEAVVNTFKIGKVAN